MLKLAMLKAQQAIWAAGVRSHTARLSKATTDANLAKYSRLLTEAKVELVRVTRKIVALSKKTRKAHWNPDATKVRGRDAGAFVTGQPRIVWHTTEGKTAEGAIAAYAATGSWPHFTFEFTSGRLFQHIPLNRAARSLSHPDGTVETNRAHAYQVELVGFAAESPKWTAEEYARIAVLARWLELATGVRRHASAAFMLNPPHLTDREWLAADGHTGHEHVPNSKHWDPGAMRIASVLKEATSAPTTTTN